MMSSDGPSSTCRPSPSDASPDPARPLGHVEPVVAGPRRPARSAPRASATSVERGRAPSVERARPAAVGRRRRGAAVAGARSARTTSVPTGGRSRLARRPARRRRTHGGQRATTQRRPRRPQRAARQPAAHRVDGRISPSCTTETTSSPSRVKMQPPGQAPAAGGRRRVLVVEQPLVGPERPVEPHGVVEAGHHAPGRPRSAAAVGEQRGVEQGHVRCVGDDAGVQHRVVGQLAVGPDPDPLARAAAGRAGPAGVQST